jgi:Flp pilus assembly protein TadG
MKRSFLPQRAWRSCHGQTLVMFVSFLVVLIIFVGLGIDLGFAYVTKAKLSKALDAAALTGAHNVLAANRDQLANSVFAMNYGAPSRDVGGIAPTPTGTITTDAGIRTYTISATATINTYFIRILPMWRTLHVRATASAIRSRAVISIILDKSGSLALNNGWRGIAGVGTDSGVDTFIVKCGFDETIDKMALIRFSTVAETPVTLRQPYITAISNAVPRQQSNYAGATFMEGGLANGWVEINRDPVVAGENVTRAEIGRAHV